MVTLPFAGRETGTTVQNRKTSPIPTTDNPWKTPKNPNNFPWRLRFWRVGWGSVFWLTYLKNWAYLISTCASIYVAMYRVVTFGKKYWLVKRLFLIFSGDPLVFSYTHNQCSNAELVRWAADNRTRVNKDAWARRNGFYKRRLFRYGRYLWGWKGKWKTGA